MKKKNYHIFSSHLRADQTPGPSGEDQLMCTLYTVSHVAVSHKYIRPQAQDRV